MKEGQVSEFDVENGYPHLCSWCGFAWSVHRGTDNRCPGRREDGTLWRGQWDPKNGSSGTVYEPVE